MEPHKGHEFLLVYFFNLGGERLLNKTSKSNRKLYCINNNNCCCKFFVLRKQGINKISKNNKKFYSSNNNSINNNYDPSPLCSSCDTKL